MRPRDSPRLEWVGDFGEVWDPSHARGCRRRPERRLRQAGGDPVWLALCPQVSEREGLWQAGGWGEEEEVQGPPLACRALSLLSTSLADPHGVLRAQDRFLRHWASSNPAGCLSRQARARRRSRPPSTPTQAGGEPPIATRGEDSQAVPTQGHLAPAEVPARAQPAVLGAGARAAEQQGVLLQEALLAGLRERGVQVAHLRLGAVTGHLQPGGSGRGGVSHNHAHHQTTPTILPRLFGRIGPLGPAPSPAPLIQSFSSAPALVPPGPAHRRATPTTLGHAPRKAHSIQLLLWT